MSAPSQVSRRRVLRAMAGAALAAATPGVARAHDAVGLVQPPQALPDFPVRCSDGRRVALSTLLRGRVTAIQFMFTGCSATCPLQGAIFGEAQRALAGRPRAAVQLLSLSIDPLADDPKALARWLARFGGGRQWLAAAPQLDALDRMRSMFRPPGTPSDDHDTQVFIVDRQGLLVYRTAPLPPPVEVADLLGRLAGA